MSDPSGIEIREARTDDADVMFTWRNDPESRRWFHNQEPLTWGPHLEWVTNRLAKKPSMLWVAEFHGITAGCVRLDPDADGRGLVSVIVDPGARGVGVGTHLIAWVDAQAQALGYDVATAEVHPGNDASQALFIRAGYSREGTGANGFLRFAKRLRSEGSRI